LNEYTPADVPGLPAGWEINSYESNGELTLSLWRVQAFLKPYKETRGEDALHYSGGRHDDAELPVGYTQEDLEEALQELASKAQSIDDMVEESLNRYGLFYPLAENRPTRERYFRKKDYV
jgi:hypothetical protein